MRYLALLALVLTGCGGIQTEPTCRVEQYGLITLQNRTDEWKIVYLSKVVHDGERYKAAGYGKVREVPPLTEARMRVAPGMVMVRVDYVEGRSWMRVFLVRMCDTTNIRLTSPVAFREIPRIQSRRSDPR